MTDDPLDLAPIAGRDAHAECAAPLCHQPEADRRTLLAEVKRLRAEVERLRQQNKTISDEWTQRTADLQSYRDRWENLRRHAHRLLVVREDGGRWLGYSQIQEAQVAAALADPEDAAQLLAALKVQPEETA